MSPRIERAKDNNGSRNISLNKDYFSEKDGIRFAGLHLLIEFWGSKNLNDVDIVRSSLSRAATQSKATILEVNTHQFNPSGVTGVAILAESHISIHTWPEHGFAAIDVFMCGNCDPYAAIESLKQDFLPDRVLLSEHKRGMQAGS
ncbi:MAG: adenosylmethionine decarboxylase [Candidatus Thiodiazotropha sp. (ex Monitilora ramsayi)]|nr:adenosylmethionine decarboxylase [Candidatus Thiodiazotropha sp. (ex Monitilora ramsayi)]